MNISDFENAIQESLSMYLSLYVHIPTVIVPIVGSMQIMIMNCEVTEWLHLSRDAGKY